MRLKNPSQEERRKYFAGLHKQQEDGAVKLLLASVGHHTDEVQRRFHTELTAILKKNKDHAEAKAKDDAEKKNADVEKARAEGRAQGIAEAKAKAEADAKKNHPPGN